MFSGLNHFGIVHLCNFCPLLLRNSASSTVQTEPFPPSTRTKHLWRLRLCRTAFYMCGIFKKNGEKYGNLSTLTGFYTGHSFSALNYTCYKKCLLNYNISSVFLSAILLFKYVWLDSCNDCGLKLLLVATETQSKKVKCVFYLPCGCVMTEVEELACEPVIDFIQC